MKISGPKGKEGIRNEKLNNLYFLPSGLDGLFLRFLLISLSGVRLSPLGTSATVGLLYQPRMIDGDYGAVGGMRIAKGNRTTQQQVRKLNKFVLEKHRAKY
jgi:hypothetical protein